MSLEVRDFRKHSEEQKAKAAKLALDMPVEMAQQAPVEGSTGDDRLDKANRILQAELEACEAHLLEVAAKGMGAANHDMLTVCQFEYMYTKGKSDALKYAQTVSYKVLSEEKSKV